LEDANGWAFTFANDSNSVCPQGGLFDAKPTYAALGSGAGLAAMCVNGTTLDATKDWGASDDPPTGAQVAAMNGCTGAVSPPLAIHTIPVAQAAIGIAVHLPSGCTINSNDFASTGNRFAILNQNLEKALLNGGGAPTWSTLLPNSPSCSGPIKRAVRYDQSGTTFQTEQYLKQIGDAATWQAASGNLQFQNWPNNGNNIIYGGTTSENPPGTCPLSGPGSTPPDPANGGQTQPANRSLCNGAGHVAQAVLDTPGSIGYVDMSTQIAKGFQYPSKGGSDHFWVPVQHNGTGTKGSQTYADPNATSNGYISGNSTGGANCASASYTPPGGADPTLSNWDGVIGSNPNTANYPICTLTYELAWDNAAKAYGNTGAIDARQRTVKDYLTYMTDTGTNDGQSILRSLNYDTVPASVLSVAQAGVGSIHFP
jgi:ABC-type phosphate transport system substrate-binding protein